MASSGGAPATSPPGAAPGGGSSSPAPFFGNTGLSPPRALAASTFLAGDESLSIVPSFHLPEPLALTSGTVGPFRAGMDAVVPLWLGTMLRRRNLCRIVPPPWMDAEVLREVLRFERDPREASFSPDLPFRHAELARAVLAACRTGSGSGSGGGGGDGGGGDTEIPEADKVKILLEDIAAVRTEKIRRNVHQLSASTLTRSGKHEAVIDVTNIGSLEMHAVKPFVAEAFRLHRELSGKGSSYSKEAEPEQSDGGGRSAGGRSGGTAGTRGRLRRSRLARESREARGAGDEEEGEEELMEPRPMEEPEGGDDDMAAGAGERSNLRRHR
ncbi:hypothetical protein ACHAWF_000928 [Thalassiosira exigua]